ncbi:AAA family ATPase [Blattabacterium cuenoti]|uniref:AAA family ATPase n=1 Tax=Blattabacterium cuenoti TaxID=1653831 RepID=UPI00163B90CF|nr:AAA family ATPase [Blattabacterium cuenoti]
MKEMLFYIVLTKKYRPLKWNDVVGQKEITVSLRRAITKSRLSQILFFFGPKGVGKNTCARLLAKELNSFSESEDQSFNLFEINGFLKHSIEDIYEIVSQIRFYPKKGKYKIFIINNTQFFSQKIFNVFFKFFEKLPSHVLFIFCDTKKNRILDSFISRCQVYEFQSISLKDIYLYLKMIAEKEEIEIEKEALFIISQYVNGSLSDAIDIFDKLIFHEHEEKKIISKEFVMEKLGILDPDYYFQIIDSLLDEKTSYKVLILLDQIFKKKIHYIHFINGFTKHLKDLFLSKYPETRLLLKLRKKTTIQSYIQQSEKISSFFLRRALMICCKMENELEFSKNPRLIIEIYLIQLSNFLNKNFFCEKFKNILQENWENFLIKFSDKINPTYLNLLTKEIQFHILSKNKILLIAPSKLGTTREFFFIQTYFVKYFRKIWKNPYLEFKIMIQESENSKKEQYDFLSKKNKYVEKLIKRLNLKVSSS